MRLLLDSHTLIWTAFASTLLSPAAREAVADPASDRFVSPISVYELEVKRVAGKMPYPPPPSWHAAIASAGLTVLPFTVNDGVLAAALPRHHGDPWDRLLIAQAISHGLTVVTTDTKFPAYGVPTLW